MFRASRSLLRRPKSIVSTDLAPAAIGPYSQATKANGFMFVSGCLGLDAKTMEFPSEYSAASQAEMALKNMEEVLKAGGSSASEVVKTTVLLANMEDFASVNEVYAKSMTHELTSLTHLVFPEHPPARACYACKTLPKNALVEIEAIATYKE